MVEYAKQSLAVETRRTSAPTLNKAVALNRLGTGAVLHGRLAEGDSLINLAYATLLAIGARSNIEMLDVQNNRQGVAIERGRLALADSIIADGLRIALETYGVNSRERALFLTALAMRAQASGNPIVAKAAADTAIHIIDSIPDVVTNVRVAAHYLGAVMPMLDLRWDLADSVLRSVLRELGDRRPGIQLVQALLTHGYVLTRQKQYVLADSQFVRAQQAFASSGLKLREVSRMISGYRGTALGLAGNLKAMERELAVLPAEQSTWYRNSVRKARLEDSLAALRAGRAR
jgi:hypothetical protein